MTPRSFDATVADWLREGPETGPRHGLERALAATRRVGQRPAWVFPRRLLPRPMAEFDLRVPASVSRALVLVLVLLLLLALAIALVGQRPRIPLPFVPAADRPIAFQEGPAIFVAHLDGSDRRKLSGDLPFAYAPMVSPDGTLVAFLAPPNATETGGRLLVAAIDGSAPLIEASQGWLVVPGQVPSVTWSPDGTRLAFAASSGGISRIFVTAGIGKDVAPITDDTANADLPTWSPDGTLIAFRVTDLDGVNRHIRTVQPDGSGLTTINDMIAPEFELFEAQFRTAERAPVLRSELRVRLADASPHRLGFHPHHRDVDRGDGRLPGRGRSVFTRRQVRGLHHRHGRRDRGRRPCSAGCRQPYVRRSTAPARERRRLLDRVGPGRQVAVRRVARRLHWRRRHSARRSSRGPQAADGNIRFCKLAAPAA